MTVFDTIAALALAGIALYGLGVPLAWLLPAPAESQWVHRIAVAPLFAMVLSSAGAWMLRTVGIPLHPLQLLALILGAWTLAWWRTRVQWNVRKSLREGVGPAMMVAVSGVVWGFSLVGYGLYLPNRDFKNHAYFVAQVASSQTSDPTMVLRASPLSPPSSGGIYPLGLHTLLGWSLPTTDWNSMGVTAGAAILCTSVSLPLALVVLARQLMPANRLLWVIAGFAACCAPGLTATFSIGSVVLLAGTALYTAGLGCVWQWCSSPRAGELVALGLAGVGLLLLHIAEAWGLLAVAIASIPMAMRSGRRPAASHLWVGGALAFAALAIAFVVLREALPTLSESRFDDIEPNTLEVPQAIVFAFFNQPGGTAFLSAVWMVLTVVGLWLTITRRLSLLPVVSLLVPMGFAVLASASGVPEALNLLTAPWYGSTSRIYLMAAGPILLLGTLAMVAASGSLDEPVVDGPERGVHPRRLRGVSVLGMTSLVFATWTMHDVTERRTDLAATLAGTRSLPEVAAELERTLNPGETVLTFEGDGTANLFAFARVPVLVGWDELQVPEEAGFTLDWLTEHLLELGSPSVAEALAALNVRFIVLGTGSLYWDSQPGYDPGDLVDQTGLTVRTAGSDLLLLEYQGPSNG